MHEVRGPKFATHFSGDWLSSKAKRKDEEREYRIIPARLACCIPDKHLQPTAPKFSWGLLHARHSDTVQWRRKDTRLGSQRSWPTLGLRKNLHIGWL